jgi:hypothetical protein
LRWRATCNGNTSTRHKSTAVNAGELSPRAEKRTRAVAVERLDVNRPEPAGADDLSQPFRVVLIRFIDLHLESGAGMPSVETNDFKSESAEFMHQPWRHRASLDANAGIISRMSAHHSGDLFRRRGALAPPQPATSIVHDANGCHFLRNVQTDEVGHHG